MTCSLRTTTLIFFLFTFVTSQARADDAREFLMSCTYGVMTGALVGAASLAVEDEPDQKLHRIARGASLGLYTGILLGLYVVYLLPSQMEKQANQPNPEDLPQIDDGSGDDDDDGGYDYDDGYEYQEVEDLSLIHI